MLESRLECLDVLYTWLSGQVPNARSFRGMRVGNSPCYTGSDRYSELSKRGYRFVSVIEVNSPTISSRTYHARQAAFTGGCSSLRRCCMLCGVDEGGEFDSARRRENAGKAGHRGARITPSAAKRRQPVLLNITRSSLMPYLCILQGILRSF